MKTAVVYYSMSGNTEMTAQRIAEQTGADLIAIAPQKAYPNSGVKKFFWGGKSAVMGETPALQPYTFDAQAYDTVILGAPLWASRLAPPIRSFVSENFAALQEKRVAAFVCCSGSSAAKAIDGLQKQLGTALTAQMVLTDPKSKPQPDTEQKIADFCTAVCE